MCRCRVECLTWLYYHVCLGGIYFPPSRNSLPRCKTSNGEIKFDQITCEHFIPHNIFIHLGWFVCDRTGELDNINGVLCGCALPLAGTGSFSGAPNSNSVYCIWKLGTSAVHLSVNALAVSDDDDDDDGEPVLCDTKCDDWMLALK